MFLHYKRRPARRPPMRQKRHPPNGRTIRDFRVIGAYGFIGSGARAGAGAGAFTSIHSSSSSSASVSVSVFTNRPRIRRRFS